MDNLQNIDSLINQLNPQQRAAVEDYNGSSLVIAGAGSGKTRVLTMRIANMLNHGIKPYNILALTFTNKAAREMKERISTLLPANAIRGLWMGTFHSVFCRILRDQAGLLGFPESFTIYDTADSRNVVKSIIKQMELSEDNYKPNEVASRISLAKNNLILPTMYAYNDKLLDEDRHSKKPQLYQVYEKYMAQCRQNGAMDFDDILLYMNILLKNHPEVVQKYGELFRYILVDEYQDTNFSQYLIVKKLASIHGNICVVGDDSQSIYSFRGARIENILRFQQDYPQTKTYKLEQNYRSTSNIVNAANSLIEKNSQRLPKKLFSAREQGDPIKVIYTQSDKEEALRVASDIHTTMYSRQALASDFAILYRTNAQSRAFEEHLRNKGIAYRIYGGQSFYQRAEIKDMIAYLRFAVNPDDDQALLRIINFPARGIGATSLAKVEAAAQHSGTSMWRVMQNSSAAALGIKGVAVKSLDKFIETFRDISSRASAIDAYELAMEVVKRSGVIAHYQSSRLIEDESRLQNTEELLNSIKTFVTDFANREQLKDQTTEDQASAEYPMESDNPEIPTIGLWLQDVSLLTDMDQQDQDNEPRVTLLTVHASKGLEFKYTYVVGMEENLFPSLKGVESQDSIEEERRLFYVALTRAEVRATLTFSTTRFKWGQVVNSMPSRFIREIDPEYIDMPSIMNYLSSDSFDNDDDLPTSLNRRQINSTYNRGYSPNPSQRGTSRAESSNTTSDNQYQRRSTPSSSNPRTQQGRSQADNNYSPNLMPPPAGFRKVVSPTSSQRSYSSTSDANIANSESSRSVSNVSPANVNSELHEGTRVSHSKFGKGTIIALEKTASDTKVIVNFESEGTKTLLLKFAKLTVI